MRVFLCGHRMFSFLFLSITIRILEGLSIYKNINKRIPPWTCDADAPQSKRLALHRGIFSNTKMTFNSWRYKAIFLFWLHWWVFISKQRKEIKANVDSILYRLFKITNESVLSGFSVAHMFCYFQYFVILAARCQMTIKQQSKIIKQLQTIVVSCVWNELVSRYKISKNVLTAPVCFSNVPVRAIVSIRNMYRWISFSRREFRKDKCTWAKILVSNHKGTRVHTYIDFIQFFA